MRFIRASLSSQQESFVKISDSACFRRRRPVNAVALVCADELQAVDGERAARDDVAALVGQVQPLDFGLGRFVSLGRPRIDDPAEDEEGIGRTVQWGRLVGYMIIQYIRYQIGTKIYVKKFET